MNRLTSFRFVFVTLGFFISALVSNVQAQLFAPAVLYSVGDEPFRTFAADFDGDGYVDLATANSALAVRGQGSISIRLNNGNGTFAPAVNYLVPGQPLSTQAADFDGDGDLDLAVPLAFPLLPGSDSLAILFNNGNGMFVNPMYYQAGAGANYSFAADFDNDGDQDLALIHSENQLYIFLNDGTGTFVRDSIYLGGNELHDIYSADFEPDGDADLVIANFFGNSVSIFLNNGDATFAARVDYPVGDSVNSVCAADFNDDGFVDLAVSCIFDEIFILLNKGDSSGAFLASVQYRTGARGVHVSSADYDNDGDFDLSVANGNSNEISILLNNGTGAFILENTYAAGSRTFHVFSADFDNDGNADVVATNRNGDNVSVLINNTITSVQEIGRPLPSAFALDQNFPNPFNPSTNIRYEIPVQTNVTLKIYSILGQEVVTLVNETKQPGRYEVPWNGVGVSSGIYFYRITAGEFIKTKKLFLLR